MMSSLQSVVPDGRTEPSARRDDAPCIGATRGGFRSGSFRSIAATFSSVAACESFKPAPATPTTASPTFSAGTAEFSTIPTAKATNPSSTALARAESTAVITSASVDPSFSAAAIPSTSMPSRIPSRWKYLLCGTNERA